MNRNTVIVGVVVLIIAGVLGAFVLTKGSSDGETANTTPTPSPTPAVKILPADALSVTFKKGASPRYVLTIDKLPEGVESLSYEITYDTTNKGTQGIVGSPPKLKDGQTKYTNPEIVFGSESRGKYVLDQGVSNIQINIRLIFKDGTKKGWNGSLEI